VLTAISSGSAHHRRAAVLWPSVAWLVPGMLLGGWLGARFAGLLDAQLLRAGVVLFCVVAALQLWRSQREDSPVASRVTPRGAALTAGGVLIGTISALVGIGGGSLTVPLLIARGARSVHAVGSSAVCGFFIAAAAAIGYATLEPPLSFGDDYIGFLYWPGALLLAVASVVAAPLGARLAHAMRGLHLQRLFAAFLLLMAALTWWAPRGNVRNEFMQTSPATAEP